MFSRPVILTGILSCSLLFSGCATFDRIASYPTPGQPTDVTVVAKPMSKMSELPLGAFYDEPRQIIVSGHQKGLGWGLAFGLVGVLVADKANRSGAEKRFGESTHGSTTDLGTIMREVINSEISAGHAPQWRREDGRAHVQLSPYAVFTVLKSGQARLHAMVRAEITGPDGKPSWSARYFARAAGEYTIEGEGGWMTGTHFAGGMREALQRTVQVCAADMEGKLTGARTITAKGVFPYINTDKLALPFIVVGEDDKALIAKLAAGDVLVMAGTHVLDRADYTITDSKFKDPRQK